MSEKRRRVCIIGAGVAGLCALKHSLEQGLEATAFEKSTEIGGTWVYSDNIECRYEDDVHSSMYEGLRTNLPKEVMGYPDFLYPDSIEESFISSGEVLKFLQSYAEHFNLKSHIKFQHDVIRVRPRNGEWEVYVWDHINDKCNPVYFDYVFVCNGHYTTPLYPDIENIDEYKGRKLHSHLYRRADMFKNATVLIVGGGPSAMDITDHIRKAAHRVYLSHHLQPPPPTDFMPNVTQKVDVKRFNASGAIFMDNSSEEFDFVVFCTGYQFTFHCISADSLLDVEDNFVQPLYKHCININYPTMALIGLPINVVPTQMSDLQVRFALKFFTGQKDLPSKEDMMKDMQKEMAERWARGLKKRQAHEMGKDQFDYYKDLSEIAGIENIKPVVQKMLREFVDCGRKYIYELETYRDTVYKVIDNENFVKITK